MIFYTIDRLVIDKDKSADPVDYRGEHHLRLGRELSAYLTRHNRKTKKGLRVGATTKYGPHPFFLTSKPDIDDLVYWNSVKNNKFPIVLSCNGTLMVYDHSGNKFTLEDQKKYSMAQEKVFAQQQKEDLMSSRAEKLIKKYFR